MNLLALETATSVCSVALFRDGSVVAEAAMDRPRAHSEFLVPMIREVLRFGRIAASDLSAIAVSSGPGSYTGLRIGTSTAKGLATAVNIPLVSVPSLFALADLARPFAVQNDRIAVAFDARRDEAYVALYRVTATGSLSAQRPTESVRAGDATAWLKEAAGGTTYLVGNGWMKMRYLLEEASLRYVNAATVRPSAVSVARIAAAKLERGEVEDVVTFEPYYLKEFVPTKPKASAFEKLSF